MANPAGEPVDGPLPLDFDRRLKLGFHGCGITTDAGLPACREPDDVLGLTDMAGHELVDPRTGKNGRHAMTGLFRRSVFGRLGGHEYVSDADRPGRDPAMRWIVGGRPPHDPVLMFSIPIIQAQNTLSDDRAEFLISDRLSFMRFPGPGLQDKVPDAKTIRAFPERLTRAIDAPFARFETALRDAGYIAMSGQLVDSTPVAAPRQRNTDEEKKDIDARWTVRFGRAKTPVPTIWETASDRSRSISAVASGYSPAKSAEISAGVL